MSDPGAAPDPMDKAYVQAEAVLSDEDARAARRARVLAAVAREPVTPLAASSPSVRRPAWRRGGWLVAASVAGLSVFVATQIHQPVWRQPQTAPSAPTPAARGIAALPGSPAQAPSEAPAPRDFAAAPRAAIPAQTASPPNIPPTAPPPAPALSIAPAPRAFPDAAAAPPPPPRDAVVTAERRAPAPAAQYPGPVSGGAGDEAVDAQGLARGAAKRAPSPAFAAPPAAALSRFESSAGTTSDQAARLRAAAAAGRTTELEALLEHGVPVDAPDADGNTALMKSIQADHPAATALLRRHGARLDRKNRAGESARDMATDKGDAELNQAVGVGP
jgi:hypothetical protein